MDNRTDDKRVDELQKKLAGCGRCDYDEAGGELMDHCPECQRTITTLAYELLVKKGWKLIGTEQMTRLIAERDAARLIAKKRLELLVAEGIV